MTRLFPAAALACLLPVLSAAQEASDDQTAAVDQPAADAEVMPSRGNFTLELNNAATMEGNICQLTYVAVNDSDVDLARVSYQVGFFDTEGVVRRILVLDFGALPPGKTRIVPFNLPEQSCADVSRIVVNDVAQCETTGGDVSDVCSATLEASSRTDIQFGL